MIFQINDKQIGKKAHDQHIQKRSERVYVVVCVCGTGNNPPVWTASHYIHECIGVYPMFLALFLGLILEIGPSIASIRIEFTFMFYSLRSIAPTMAVCFAFAFFSSHNSASIAFDIYIFIYIFTLTLMPDSMNCCRSSLSECAAVNSFAKHLWISFDVLAPFCCVLFWSQLFEIGIKLLLSDILRKYRTHTHKISIQIKVIDTLLNCLFLKTNIMHSISGR